MIEKVVRLAEKASTAAGTSRRRFLGRFAGLAGGAVLGLLALANPGKADVDPECFRECQGACIQECLAEGGYPLQCLQYCRPICECCCDPDCVLPAAHAAT